MNMQMSIQYAIDRKFRSAAKAKAEEIIVAFYRYAEVAAENGGFWVSAGGGTTNVVAGAISRATGVPFEDVRQAMSIYTEAQFGSNASEAMAWMPGNIAANRGDWDEIRFDADTIVKAAINAVNRVSR